MQLTKQQFLARFTLAEMTGILEAAKSNTLIEAWLFQFSNSEPDADAPSVDTTYPITIQGVHSLEMAGLLAAGRANQILGVVQIEGVSVPTISLQTGQPCARDPGFTVVTGGDYPENELVDVEDQNGNIVRFQAHYIATGEFK